MGLPVRQAHVTGGFNLFTLRTAKTFLTGMRFTRRKASVVYPEWQTGCP